MNMQLKPVRIGLFFAVLTLLLSYSLGMIFGGFGDQFEEYGKNTLETHRDAFKTDKKINKGYESYKKYTKRAHLHAGAIGAGSTAMVIVLSLLGNNILWLSQQATYKVKMLLSLALGVGAFFYASYWTLVAIGVLSNPDKYAVKDGPLAILAYIGAGPVYLATCGLVLILFLSIFYKGKQES